MNEEFHFSGFYRAIVVDNDDPTRSGRVKVRVMPMFKDVGDSALPWAIYADSFMGNVNTGAINIPEIGTHLFVFFEQGDHRYPVYFASAPAIQNEIPDIPSLSREGDVSVNNINTNKQTNIPTATGGSWDEPDSAYAAEYPNNHVWRTQSGLTVELDDTDGEIRLHFYHPSGSHEEIDNDGNRVVHTQNNMYSVVISDEKIYIKGNSDKTVDGNEGIKVGNNLVIDVGNDVTLQTGNNTTISSGNNTTISTNGTTQVTSGGDLTVTAPTINLN